MRTHFLTNRWGHFPRHFPSLEFPMPRAAAAPDPGTGAFGLQIRGTPEAHRRSNCCACQPRSPGAPHENGLARCREWSSLAQGGNNAQKIKRCMKNPKPKRFCTCRCLHYTSFGKSAKGGLLERRKGVGCNQPGESDIAEAQEHDKTRLLAGNTRNQNHYFQQHSGFLFF